MKHLTDAEVSALYDAHAADVKSADRARDTGRRPVPFDGMDHAGMPAGDELARVERAAKLSWLPGHRPWEDVVEFDAKLAEITRHLVEATDRVRTLTEQLANEPVRYADELADWMAGDKRGGRPQSRATQLERDLAEAEAERDALRRNELRVLQDRAAHVERHRARLTKIADGLVEQKQRRMLELIDELEAERAGLAQCREAGLWVRLFPADTASRMPDFRPLAGNLVRVLRPLGFNSGVDAAKVLDALRGDVEWLATAVGGEQRAAVEGPRDPDQRREAVWATPEAEHNEKKAALEAARLAFIAEWQQEPTEMQLEAFIHERNLNW
jgi:hypothetical protein